MDEEKNFDLMYYSKDECVIDLSAIRSNGRPVYKCALLQGKEKMYVEFRFLSKSTTLISNTPEIPTVIDLVWDAKLTRKFLENIVMNKFVGNVRKLFPAFKYLSLEWGSKNFGIYETEYWDGPILIKDMSEKCVWDIGKMPKGRVTGIELDVISKAHGVNIRVEKFCKNNDFAMFVLGYGDKPQKRFYVKPDAVLDLKFFEVTENYVLPIAILQDFAQHTRNYANILYIPNYLK